MFTAELCVGNTTVYERHAYNVCTKKQECHVSLSLKAFLNKSPIIFSRRVLTLYITEESE